MNKMQRIILGFVCFLTSILVGRSQGSQPSATYIDENNETVTIAEGETYAGSAPLLVTFAANPSTANSSDTHYEWHFFNQTNPREAYLIRYEETTQYTFTQAGTSRVYLYEIIGTDTIRYNPISISISESSLQMPNAFSPNGDGINDIYKAKQGYRSIVEFRAIIFNRWGQKLYEWTDPAGGWDGKYKGKDVADGTYFVSVTARGADGREFNIRRDVNLLRGFNQTNR